MTQTDLVTLLNSLEMQIGALQTELCNGCASGSNHTLRNMLHVIGLAKNLLEMPHAEEW